MRRFVGGLKYGITEASLSSDRQPASRLDLNPEDAGLFNRIDPTRKPKHIAIIMDGNGRWAASRNLPRIKGHKAAITSVQETVEACVDLGIGHLTVYAFSTENWKRPANEIGTLMALLRQYLRMELKTVEKHGIKVDVLGAIHELDPGIQRDLARVLERSRNHSGMRFNIALNYSGRNDILYAIRHAQQQGLDLAHLDEAGFSALLSTAGQPDPDLVIRTSGEMRVSNFLLWQIAYSEIVVTSTLWPDFRRKHLYQAILEFQSRNRRFGGI